MDQSFFLRAKRLLGQRQPARLGHDMLVAMLAAQRAACPTVAALGRGSDQAVAADEAGALTALILADDGWRKAASLQRGCFNRAVSARRVNTR